jgi:hypothetical protein
MAAREPEKDIARMKVTWDYLREMAHANKAVLMG